MRPRHYLTLLCLLSYLMLTGVRPASAACEGPTYSHAVGDFDHGDTLTVDGMYWGDECYDTGPPPPGEEVLGLPIADIDIVLVQGETELLVANGHADEQYGFQVEIIMPTGFEPGPFEVVARTVGSFGNGYNLTDESPIYNPTDERVVPVVEATFGPDEPVTFIGTTAVPPTTEETPTEAPSVMPADAGFDSTSEAAPDGGSSAIWWLVVVAVVALGAVAIPRSRRS